VADEEMPAVDVGDLLGVLLAGGQQLFGEGCIESENGVLETWVEVLVVWEQHLFILLLWLAIQ
jgi:hypothetical protein